MILGNRAIIEACEKWDIIISPFDTANLQTSSYDITLGDWMATKNPSIKWMRDWSISQDTKEEWLLLDPGECVLTHSLEFIGGRGNITTMLKARSTIARHFISVCMCGGWGDVGYINRWTLEIKNNSENTVHIPYRSKIGQIIFLRCEWVDWDYTDKGNYQTETELSDIMKNWQPSSMIPKTNLYL